MTPTVPALWTLAASTFNWTTEITRAERTSTDIAVGIVTDGVSRVIEVETGQLWRSFPASTDAEAQALRDELDAAGGRVSIAGASIDDWLSSSRRRDDAERADFLIPQVRAAHRLGAQGIRLPFGQAGPVLWKRLLPVLHELDLVLYEEVQGQQSPSASAHRAAYDAIADLDDPHIRLLVDISMLMPALPVTYLERLRAGGVPADLVDRLDEAWCDPGTLDAVMGLLRSGAVPPAVHTLFMNLLVRFGRSDAADLRSILPLVGAVHLKFWDLDDADGRITQPVRDLTSELSDAGFAGTLTSEWGGLEWLDDDATDITRRHLDLMRSTLD